MTSSESLPPRTIGGQRYHVQRHRPRVEGLFARIERWTKFADLNDVFWRSISRDNITTWYGRSDESRIAGPVDTPTQTTRVEYSTRPDSGTGSVAVTQR